MAKVTPTPIGHLNRDGALLLDDPNKRMRGSLRGVEGKKIKRLPAAPMLGWIAKKNAA